MMFASIIVVTLSSSVTGALSFPSANALVVSEGIQFTSNNNNATATEAQESPGPQQGSIANHLDMARQALRNGNLTMAIEELIFAIELQSMIQSGVGTAQNETQSRLELQTAPFPLNS